MRHILLTGTLYLALLTTQSAYAENSKGFQLTVDGKQVGIDIGETLTLTTGDGKEIKVSLDRPQFVTTTGAFFSFDHASNLSIAESDISRDIRQYFLSSAVGTSIIIQEYKALDPRTLTKKMLQRLTRDDKKAGAKITEAPLERRLDSGPTLKGLKATIRKKSSTVDTEVLAYGNAKQGIVIVTRVHSDDKEREAGLIDTLWKSLKINF
jgi:hypothetical protein